MFYTHNKIFKKYVGTDWNEIYNTKQNLPIHTIDDLRSATRRIWENMPVKYIRSLPVDSSKN